MKFYAGLDVGGTSGRVKFSAEDKTLIGEYLGEGCAFNTEGYELGREKYRKLMDAALSKYELTSSDCLGICIAASGIDSKEQEMQMRGIFEEMGFAKEVANRCMFFADTKIMEENTPKELFENPQTPRLQDFLSKVL